MPTFTRYMVQSYSKLREGALSADEPVKYGSPEEAITAADEVRNRKAGVVAYKWQGNMRTGEAGRVSVLRRYGVLPKYAEIALGLEDHVA